MADGHATILMPGFAPDAYAGRRKPGVRSERAVAAEPGIA